jgi:flap endonuclease-1
MGVKNLMKFLEKRAPGSLKKTTIDYIFGRIIAIDASMQIYQFLISVRHVGSQLADPEGNPTSHLQGLLSRSLHFIQSGIRPIYVFDGKPPEMKSGELAKRAVRREEAQHALEAALEAGNEEDIDRFSRRTVRLEQSQVDECKRLLDLMGIPYVQAPCEAEAECAALCRAGKADATATEDMDALAHATPVLLRHLSYSAAGGRDVISIDFAKVLQETGLTREQFVDFCILCGCDYCETIHGIGPKKAYELIQQKGTIEEIIESLDTNKFQVPEDFDYMNARRLFFEHEVDTDMTIQWRKPDLDGMLEFMCDQKGFARQRIENAVKNLIKAKETKRQQRMDQFFSAVPKVEKPVKAIEKKPPAKPGKKK